MIRTPLVQAMRTAFQRFRLRAVSLTMGLALASVLAQAQPNGQLLTNLGQQITPLAPQGSRFEPMNPDLPDNPHWLAGQAVTTVVSPDHKTLLALTSGYNLVFNGADKSALRTRSSTCSSTNIGPSRLRNRSCRSPNTYNGIVFDPSGADFYVSGGPGDNIHIISLSAAGVWAEQPGSALALGHAAGLGLAIPPEAARSP